MSRLAVLAAATGAVAAVVAVPTTAQAQEFVPCSATALRNAITRANTTPGPATLCRRHRDHPEQFGDAQPGTRQLEARCPSPRLR
ncbi:hypothetical protein [Streptomyces sp. NPDC101115]|uniref:hypothetical protein n=1 Tax=Streptomyces sp. NPDC101115 TaxID=3366106 RepID=UPI00381D54EB